MSGAAEAARRARRLLERPGAWLDRCGADWTVRLAADRRRRPALALDDAAVNRLRRDPGLAPRREGGWLLSTRPEACAPGRLLAVDPQAAERLVNTGESPIAWLARRKGRDGRPMLDAVQIMAAERLREDFERAGMVGRLTMDWQAPPRGRSARGPERPPPGGAARRRVQAALRAVGPGLREMLEEICFYGSALQAAERTLGLPGRTGKAVLSLALTRLAAHYRFA